MHHVHPCKIHQVTEYTTPSLNAAEKGTQGVAIALFAIDVLRCAISWQKTAKSYNVFMTIPLI